MAKSIASRLDALEKMVARFLKPKRSVAKKKTRKKKTAAKKKKTAPKRKTTKRRKRPVPVMMPPTIPML